MKKFYTAESVTEGHPDKLCDLIADNVLDACLAVDPAARVACHPRAYRGRGRDQHDCAAGCVQHHAGCCARRRV